MLTRKGGRAAARLRSPIPDRRRTVVVPANDATCELPSSVTPKVAAWLAWHKPEAPCLVVDLDVVAQNYDALSGAIDPARIYYAVKANPAPEILRLLAERGSSFDVASRGEIELCFAEGIAADRLSYGNTIKKTADIAWAFAQGVRLFAFDSDEELEKLADAAPGAGVFCRIQVSGEGADYPLSRKFGCSPAMAERLLLKARELGLDALGLSFHIGSQQTDLRQWDRVLAEVARIHGRLEAEGLKPRLLNLGGGFPTAYRRAVPDLASYGEAVIAAVQRHLGDDLPDLIAEPGRGLVAAAGTIEAEVVLVSRKDDAEDVRWVYLDIGKFGGLAETMDEAIRYRIETPHDGGPTGPTIIAGPTCDSADILYEKSGYLLPLALKAGDRVRILSTGVYTTTYSAVGFNGFPPLKAVYI